MGVISFIISYFSFYPKNVATWAKNKKIVFQKYFENVFGNIKNQKIAKWQHF